jgi:hypothetical protein
MIDTLQGLYKEIDNPVDLYKWMLCNIEYGYINIYNRKRILNGNSITGWRLSSPKHMFSTKLGVCHDQAWFEHSFFKNKNIEHKVFYLEGWYHEKECGTHTFVLFKSNSVWYHFEHAWYNYRGIHMGNKDIDTTLETVLNKWSIDENITSDKIIIRELPEPPTYGIDIFSYMDYAYKSPILSLKREG